MNRLRPVTFALLASALCSAAEAQQAPARAAVHETTERALRAVENDSVAAVRAIWERSARGSGQERELAELGLASLDALTYRFEEAEQRFTRLRASARDSSVLARAAYGHAFLQQAQGLHRDSEALLREAVIAALAVGDSATASESYVLLAGARMRTQGLPVALAMLDTADQLVPNENPRARVAALCARASIHALSGRPDVVTIARSGAELAKRIGNRRAQAACIFAEAQHHVQRGDLRTADGLMREAAYLQRAARHRTALAANLQWRGYLQTTVASFGLALDLLHEAIVEATASRNMSALAWTHANLAQIYLTLNDRYVASSHSHVAERLMREQGDVRGLALVRSIRAELAMQAADTVEAARLDEEARRLVAEYGSPDLEYSVLYWRLQRYAAARDWRSARRMLDSMEANLRRRGGTGWLVGQNFLRAALALMQRDYDTAERALASFGDPREHDQPIQRYNLLVMWAELHARRGNLDQAEKHLRDASDIIDGWRQHANSRSLRHLAFQRANEFGDPDHAVATVLGLLAANGRAESAFELAERRRARQLADEMARAIALRSVVEDSVTPVEFPSGVEVDQVIQSLPDSQTALIEYVTGRGGEPTTAFIITRRGLKTVTLSPIDSVAPTLSRFVALLEAGGPSEGLARELGERLFEPVVRELPTAVRRLLIVPDDVLHRLPFDALRLHDGRYVVERFVVSTVPSAAIAVMLRARPVRAEPVRVLAMGDPVFSSETAASEGDTSFVRSVARRLELSRLQGSGLEARVVGRFADHSEVRLRDAATEAFLKEASLDTFTIIHLATHALVDDRAIGRSVLALAAGDGEDGFMTPGDVAALRLGAELVVLSACRTAGGVLLGGEGVKGLAAPFLGAGARTVVASTWPVNDRRATQLIESFYRALASGLSMGEALQAAKLEALRAGLPPREWAAWTLIGDPIASIPLQPPRGRGLWWMAAGLLAVTLYYGARTVKRWNRDVRSAPSA